MQVNYPQINYDAKPAEAIETIQRYLFQLAEQLNYALQQTENNVAGALQQAADTVEKTAEGKASIGQVRDLIIKTAEVIREEEDQMKVQLNSKYEAISSQFGTFKQQVQNNIEANGRYVEQQVLAQVNIQSVRDALGELENWQGRTEGFIKSGYIDTDDMGRPIIGIAIGRNLSSVTVGGIEKIDRNQSCAFYLPDRVSFRMNGKEVAYFSQNALHTGDIETDGKITMANRWQWKTDSLGHMSLKWVGGNT